MSRLTATLITAIQSAHDEEALNALRFARWMIAKEKIDIHKLNFVDSTQDGLLVAFLNRRRDDAVKEAERLKAELSELESTCEIEREQHEIAEEMLENENRRLKSEIEKLKERPPVNLTQLASAELVEIDQVAARLEAQRARLDLRRNVLRQLIELEAEPQDAETKGEAAPEKPAETPVRPEKGRFQTNEWNPRQSYTPAQAEAQKAVIDAAIADGRLAKGTGAKIKGHVTRKTVK